MRSYDAGEVVAEISGNLPYRFWIFPSTCTRTSPDTDPTSFRIKSGLRSTTWPDASCACNRTGRAPALVERRSRRSAANGDWPTSNRGFVATRMPSIQSRSVAWAVGTRHPPAGSVTPRGHAVDSWAPIVRDFRPCVASKSPERCHDRGVVLLGASAGRVATSTRGEARASMCRPRSACPRRRSSPP